MIQKKRMITLRLTPSEEVIFRDAAKRLEMSLSGLLREGAMQLIYREILMKGQDKLDGQVDLA